MNRQLAGVAPNLALIDVAKAFVGATEAPRVVLLPTTLAWPADRIVALLGAKRSGKSTLLQMLGGKLAPDQGMVHAPFSRSPLVNGGRLLHPQLSGFENISVTARMYGLDAGPLAELVDAFCGGALPLHTKLRHLDAAQRKYFEAALTMVLPFACYLIDDAAQLPPECFARSCATAAARGAGLVFASANARLARQYGELFVVIAEAGLHVFERAEAAIKFLERHDR